MTVDDPTERASALFHSAYEAQMRGDLEAAVDLYKRSIALHPTAEAHTFLGWTYSFQGALDDAIDECKKAIAVDPEFGNPYNDIGAYLIEMGRLDEAVPWLERATRATRYEAPHFPYFNLARVYVSKEMYTRAIQELENALAANPEYAPAREAIASIRRKLN